MQELISVIIPVYNVENYLEKCLNSVISQTYKNLEIILIEDGSTDNSRDICERFKEIDSRIKLFSTVNGGAAFARNLGLSKSTGDYITFVDSDDYIRPETIETLYDWLKSYNGDISVTYILETHEKRYYDKLQKGIVKKEEFMKYLLSDSIKSYLMGKLYKSSLWENIRFPIEEKVEDLAVVYKVFDNAEKIVNVDQKLYEYTEDNPKSETRSYRTINGLYPRCIYNFERYEYTKEKYPEIMDEVLYQAVSYGNICYIKMANKTCYNEKKQNILNYFIENKKNIMSSERLPLYKKMEALCIIHQWNVCCNILKKMHERKECIE